MKVSCYFLTGSASSIRVKMSTQELQLNTKAKKTAEKISENIHIVANDPSLAFYRVQEHVRKVLPPILERRNEVLQLQHNLQGHCYDMEYALSAVKSIEAADGIFKNMQDLLKKSIFLKKQLKYEEARSRLKKQPSRNSVYKRFSAHLTLDLPELPDFAEVMRETSHRMESIIIPTRTDQAATSSNVGSVELQRSHTTLH